MKKPILVKDLGTVLQYSHNTEKRRMGVYKCPLCDSDFKAVTGSVKFGTTKTCKRCRYAINGRVLTRHGDSNERIYNIYHAMKARCNNKSAEGYSYYGGRGISVCQEWELSYSEFKKWALSSGYSKELTIDRKDTNGNYSPTNCRWADKLTQAANQRKKKTNSSGYTGVCVYNYSNKWRAFININRKQIHLGIYENIKDAAKARDNYIDKHNLPHTKSSLSK